MLAVDGFTRIARATEIDHVVGVVKEMFGGGVALYAVDHAFDRVVEVSPHVTRGRDRPLRGRLRTAVLRARPFTDRATTWMPIPERGQVTFVLRVDGSMPNLNFEVLGLILRDHRRRFEQLERLRRRADMSIAAEMQWDLLPVRADSIGAYDVAAVLVPAYEVAGDVFDYARSPNGVWVYALDGMGHGLDATMASVLSLTAIRNARRRGESMVAQMAAANAVLHEYYGGDRFVTGVACHLADDGRLEVVNAGHEPMRVVRDGRVEQLEVPVSLPLGVDASTSYERSHVVSLALDAGLVLLSDGLAEARRSDGEVFGRKRVDDSLGRRWTTTPLETAHAVADDVLGFLDDDTSSDDLTVVVVRHVGARR